MQSRLSALSFTNRFLDALPEDAENSTHRRQVYAAAYARVMPTQVRAPEVVAVSESVASLLGWTQSDLQHSLFTQVFAGNALIDGMIPHATAYGGHQFGHWAGQLGDGRAINLGEIKNAQGEHWALQLKGAGPTPFSRTADGLAVLRSSIREFMCSEAMFHLRVPTTRALSLIKTGEQVMRDMFYDGRPAYEPGAVVCRVAPSFNRFGHIELPAQRGDYVLLKQWVDYSLQIDYPDLAASAAFTSDTERYVAWFHEICRRTAIMIAEWMRVGFVHGVMNTDNMSLLGLTIDYGPYGWIDAYDPNWTPNTTDAQGKRYRFGNQPQIGMWNVAQLANAIYPLIGATEPLQAGLEVYRTVYYALKSRYAREKLGLLSEQQDDDDLYESLTLCMAQLEIDMTIFFRLLSDVTDLTSNKEALALLADSFYHPLSNDEQDVLTQWLGRYLDRLAQDKVLLGTTDVERKSTMNTVNPKYVLRNYLAQNAIERAEQNDYSEIARLSAVLMRPYDEQPEAQHYFSKRPEWAKNKAGCSMLSCSS